MRLKHFFGTLVLCSFACVTLWGQATGQINGTVSDTSGALIPGVDVMATQTATGIGRSAVTNENGVYIIPSLPVGPYRVEASLPGFRTFVQTGITLEVNSTRVVNLVLEVGQVTETVEVQSDAAMVEARSTGIGTTITNTQILQLPLVGRQTQDLIALIGGAVETGREGLTSRSFPGIARFSIAGGTDRANSYTLDGASHNEVRRNLGLPLPFPDALQEFKVETSAVPAQYGFRSGGAINAVTKSGTNEYHGAGFWFVRNAVFNARNFFADKRDPLKRNQFGGTIGGPVMKNKVFFFGGLQATRERNDSSINRSFVPTAAMLNGDFRTYASAGCQGSNITLAQPFVNNVVSVSQLSPAAVKMAQRLPKPVDECGSTFWGTPFQLNEYEYVSKLNYQFTNNHSMFWRYSAVKYHSPVGTDFTDNPLATTTPGLNSLFQSGTFGDTITIGPNIVNSFRAGWNRTAQRRLNPTYFDADDLGIKAWHMFDGMIIVNVAGAFSVGARTTTPTRYAETGYQVSNDLGLIHGNHQMNFGGNYQPFQTNVTAYSGTPGLWDFTNAPTGLAMASFMLGRLNSLAQGGTSWNYVRTKIFALYGQDSWQVRRGLNLSMGLRWEPFIPPGYVQDVSNYFNIDLFLANQRSAKFKNAPAGIFYPGDSQFPGNGSNPVRSRLDKFAPRVGLSWDPFRDGKTVVRAAYGIFYETQVAEFNISVGQGAPWAGFANITNASFDDPWAGVAGGNPFPFVPGPNSPYPPSGVYAVTHPDTQPPYVQQWNFGVQREVAPNWLVSASYIGNQLTHLYGGRELNPGVYIPGVGDANGNCFTTVYGRSASVRVNPGAACSTTTNLNARRTLGLLDPTGVLGSSIYGYMSAWDDGGTRSYNGMLLSLNKRMTNYSVSANYTLSHCIGNVSNTLLNSSPGVGVWSDPTTRDYDRGNCNSDGADNRHLLNGTAVINTPRFANSTTNTILGNWSLSGILRARSGSWQNAIMTGDSPLTGVNPNNQRPDVLSANIYGTQCKSDLRASNPTCRWYDRNAFAVPASGKLGSAGLATLQGPGSWTIDLGLSRRFNIREAQRIEFRMEASNVLNHTNFTNPSSSISSAQFGRITGALDPRIIQFGLKYDF